MSSSPVTLGGIFGASTCGRPRLVRRFPLMPLLPLMPWTSFDQLLWPIHRWQGKAAFAVTHEQYEKAKAELKRLGKELKRIANTLVPPKPRFSKLKRDPEFLSFYAERFFFWTLLHEEYQVLCRDKWKRNPSLALSGLKRHYAYLDLPPDFDDTTMQNSPHANACQDVAARFNVEPESILPLINKWLGPRTRSRLKK